MAAHIDDAVYSDKNVNGDDNAFFGRRNVYKYIILKYCLSICLDEYFTIRIVRYIVEPL